jgi:hypothetical protein
MNMVKRRVKEIHWNQDVRLGSRSETRGLKRLEALDQPVDGMELSHDYSDLSSYDSIAATLLFNHHPGTDRRLELQVLKQAVIRENILSNLKHNLQKAVSLVKYALETSAKFSRGPRTHLIHHQQQQNAVNLKILDNLAALRHATVTYVECLNTWRMSAENYDPLMPHLFYWRGCNYTMKVVADLDFLQEHPSVLEMLGIPVDKVTYNPLMLPATLVDPDDYISPQEKALKDAKGYTKSSLYTERLKLRKAERILRQEVDNDAMANRSSVTSFSETGSELKPNELGSLSDWDADSSITSEMRLPAPLSSSAVAHSVAYSSWVHDAQAQLSLLRQSCGEKLSTVDVDRSVLSSDQRQGGIGLSLRLTDKYKKIVNAWELEPTRLTTLTSEIKKLHHGKPALRKSNNEDEAFKHPHPRLTSLSRSVELKSKTAPSPYTGLAKTSLSKSIAHPSSLNVERKVSTTNTHVRRSTMIPSLLEEMKLVYSGIEAPPSLHPQHPILLTMLVENQESRDIEKADLCDKFVVKVYDAVASKEASCTVHTREYSSLLEQLHRTHGDQVLKHFVPGLLSWWVTNIRDLVLIKEKDYAPLTLSISKRAIEAKILASLHDLDSESISQSAINREISISTAVVAEIASCPPRVVETVKASNSQNNVIPHTTAGASLAKTSKPRSLRPISKEESAKSSSNDLQRRAVSGVVPSKPKELPPPKIVKSPISVTFPKKSDERSKTPLLKRPTSRLGLPQINTMSSSTVSAPKSFHSPRSDRYAQEEMIAATIAASSRSDENRSQGSWTDDSHTGTTPLAANTSNTHAQISDVTTTSTYSKSEMAITATEISPDPALKEAIAEHCDSSSRTENPDDHIDTVTKLNVNGETKVPDERVPVVADYEDEFEAETVDATITVDRIEDNVVVQTRDPDIEPDKGRNSAKIENVDAVDAEIEASNERVPAVEDYGGEFEADAVDSTIAADSIKAKVVVEDEEPDDVVDECEDVAERSIAPELSSPLFSPASTTMIEPSSQLGIDESQNYELESFDELSSSSPVHASTRSALHISPDAKSEEVAAVAPGLCIGTAVGLRPVSSGANESYVSPVSDLDEDRLLSSRSHTQQQNLDASIAVAAIEVAAKQSPLFSTSNHLHYSDGTSLCMDEAPIMDDNSTDHRASLSSKQQRRQSSKSTGNDDENYEEDAFEDSPPRPQHLDSLLSYPKAMSSLDYGSDSSFAISGSDLYISREGSTFTQIEGKPGNTVDGSTVLTTKQEIETQEDQLRGMNVDAVEGDTPFKGLQDSHLSPQQPPYLHPSSALTEE